MGWLSLISCLGISLWLIWRFFGAQTLSKQNILFGFVLKLGFALAYLLIFTFYFGDGNLYGDSARFFQDSQIIQSVFSENPLDFLRLILGQEPESTEATSLLHQTSIWAEGQTANWINDNRLILKLNALIHFFSFGNVYVHATVFAFLSFTGIFLIYKTFESFVANKKHFWWFIIAFPNLSFWGTSFLKESLFIFGFGIWCWAISKLLSKHYWYIFLLLIAGSFLLLNKPYAGLIIVGFSAFIIIGIWLKWTKNGLLALALISVMAFGISLIIPGKLNLTNRLSIKQNDLNNLGKGGIAFITDSSFCVFPYSQLDNFDLIEKDSIVVLESTEGEYKLFGPHDFQPFTIPPSPSKYAVYLVYAPSHSYHEPTLINGSAWQLLKNSGAALVNVFIRPFPTDNGDGLKNLSFACNLLLLFFLIFAVIKRKPIDLKIGYLLTAIGGTAIIIALIVGWSVPIFGAIVRYKIPVELLLIIFAFIILKPLKNDKI